MRIAQVAPLIEDVPPRFYGGTERVVSYLTEELVGLGHDVTLFASGTSVTSANLVPVVPEALRLAPGSGEPLFYYMIMLDLVRQRLDEFDIAHFHIDALHYPVVRPYANRVLTTLHGRLDVPGLRDLYRAFHDLPLVSISENQRRPVPDANFIATVPHGLPANCYRPTTGGDYLAFLGRLAPEKRPDLAIEIARRAGIKLKVAAKIDTVDQAYFRDSIAPLLRQGGIEFVGEINDHEKDAFLGQAAGLLFPIAWPEPFGLVMIEAMAYGTPVLAFRAGSVTEVIENGRSGIIVDSIDQAVAALPALLRLDRGVVRRCFDERFSSRRMALDYLAIYDRLIAARSSDRTASFNLARRNRASGLR